MIRLFKGYFLTIFAFLYSYLPSKRSKFYDLVIVRVDALGDYIIWHDALSAYQEVFNNKKVLLICADLVKPLAEKEPFFTDIIEFNRKKFSTEFSFLFKQLKRLKSISSAMIVYPIWQRHPIGDMMIAQMSSPKKIAMVPGQKNRIWNKLFAYQYSRLIDCLHINSEIKSIEYFTQQVIKADYCYGNHPYILCSDANEIESEYVVVAFSASTESKSWELEKFARVIDFIPDEYKVVLTGAGKGDVCKAEQLLHLIHNRGRIINMVSKTSVVDLVMLISNSSLVVGNDSASVHIAAATRVKSVCVLLGAHYGRFLPYPDDLPFKDYLPVTVFHRMNCYGCDYQCNYADQYPFECLKNVSAEEVITQVLKILEN